MINLDSILKSRDITFPAKVHLVKAMVFPVIMYRCESWTIKKVERQRIDAFKLWCWRRLLQVPWIARRSNQSVLKEINLEYSLERLMLKLKLQYFGHLMWRADAFELWCWRRILRVVWTARRSNAGEGNGKPLQYSCLENPNDRGVWWPTVHGVTKSWTWLSD